MTFRLPQEPVNVLRNLERCVDEAFAELIRDPALVAELSALTGVHRFRLLLDQIQMKPARTGGLNGWHRDMPTFPLIRPYTAITAWIALDDATDTSGCMRFVPESHRWGEAWDIATDWGIPELPRTFRSGPRGLVEFLRSHGARRTAPSLR